MLEARGWGLETGGRQNQAASGAMERAGGRGEGLVLGEDLAAGRCRVFLWLPLSQVQTSSLSFSFPRHKTWARNSLCWPSARTWSLCSCGLGQWVFKASGEGCHCSCACGWLVLLRLCSCHWLVASQESGSPTELSLFPAVSPTMGWLSLVQMGPRKEIESIRVSQLSSL